MIQVQKFGEVIRFRLARTVFGRGIYFTSAYWVDGLMIDTGCAHTVKELLGALDNLGVSLIANTHSHEDHIAGNGPIQSKFGADIFIHPLAVDFLKDPTQRRLRPYQLIMWGYPAPSKASPMGDLIETPNYNFQMVPTPGHSDDHICLYEPDRRWLFTGDTYIGGRDRALRADYNIRQIIASLKKLASLDVKVLFSGAGSVRENPHEELETKIAYLEDLGAEAMELRKKGWSLRAIQRKLLGRELPIAYYTLGHFTGMHLIRSFIEDSPQP